MGLAHHRSLSWRHGGFKNILSPKFAFPQKCVIFIVGARHAVPSFDQPRQLLLSNPLVPGKGQ